MTTDSQKKSFRLVQILIGTLLLFSGLLAYNIYHTNKISKQYSSMYEMQKETIQQLKTELQYALNKAQASSVELERKIERIKDSMEIKNSIIEQLKKQRYEKVEFINDADAIGQYNILTEYTCDSCQWRYMPNSYQGTSAPIKLRTGRSESDNRGKQGIKRVESGILSVGNRTDESNTIKRFDSGIQSNDGTRGFGFISKLKQRIAEKRERKKEIKEAKKLANYRDSDLCLN